jgi:hypothetical protein
MVNRSARWRVLKSRLELAGVVSGRRAPSRYPRLASAAHNLPIGEVEVTEWTRALRTTATSAKTGWAQDMKEIGPRSSRRHRSTTCVEPQPQARRYLPPVRARNSLVLLVLARQSA